MENKTFVEKLGNAGLSPECFKEMLDVMEDTIKMCDSLLRKGCFHDMIILSQRMAMHFTDVEDMVGNRELTTNELEQELEIFLRKYVIFYQQDAIRCHQDLLDKLIKESSVRNAKLTAE